MNMPSLSRSEAVVAVALMFGSLVVLPAFPQTCTVPGSHATIQDAIDDPSCAAITLAAEDYPESVEIRRSLSVNGPGTGGATVQGLILVAGAGVEVTLAHLTVENGCTPDAMRATGGAEITASTVDVIRSSALPCPDLGTLIFGDGFESGDSDAWTTTASGSPTPSPDPSVKGDTVQ